MGAVRGFPALRAPAHFWIGAPRSEAYFFSVPRSDIWQRSKLQLIFIFVFRAPANTCALRSAIFHHWSPLQPYLYWLILYHNIWVAYKFVPTEEYLCFSVSVSLCVTVALSVCLFVSVSVFVTVFLSVLVCLYLCLVSVWIFVSLCESLYWFWVGVAISLCDPLFFRFKSLCPISLHQGAWPVVIYIACLCVFQSPRGIFLRFFKVTYTPNREGGGSTVRWWMQMQVYFSGVYIFLRSLIIN